VENGFGYAVRRARQSEGLTLDELAARSGVSRAALSKIERGDRSPRLQHAVQIAEALGRPLNELAGRRDQVTVTVVRDGTAPRMLDPDSHAVREALLELGAGSELVRYALPPRTTVPRFPPHEAGTREAFVGIEGRVRITSGEHTVELRAGDVAMLPGDRPHQVGNPADTEATFLLLILRPRAAGPP
jgi:transcriptional regulator with XRE-family HTH domain